MLCVIAKCWDVGLFILADACRTRDAEFKWFPWLEVQSKITLLASDLLASITLCDLHNCCALTVHLFLLLCPNWFEPQCVRHGEILFLMLNLMNKKCSHLQNLKEFSGFESKQFSVCKYSENNLPAKVNLNAWHALDLIVHVGWDTNCSSKL